MPGGVPGVKPAKVLILGGGIVGSNAAQMAAGLGADVTIADINLSRLRYLSETLPKNVKTLYASESEAEKRVAGRGSCSRFGTDSGRQGSAPDHP